MFSQNYSEMNAEHWTGEGAEAADVFIYIPATRMQTCYVINLSRKFVQGCAFSPDVRCEIEKA